MARTAATRPSPHAARSRAAAAPEGRGSPAGRRDALALVLVHVEAVADVAHGTDQALEVAELGAQPPHVHVDGAGAAEVVVAPHLREQLLPGEDPGRVRGEEAQQLELLEGEVEGTALHLRRVARLVDDDTGGLDLRGGLRLGQP